MSLAGQFIEEVKALLRSRQEHKVSWIRRSANGAAHVLGKLGISSKVSEFWGEVPQTVSCVLLRTKFLPYLK